MEQQAPTVAKRRLTSLEEIRTRQLEKGFQQLHQVRFVKKGNEHQMEPKHV